MWACMKNFWKRNDGTAAIEFALIMPALVIIIMGSIELSLFFFVQTALEGATFSVSRLGKTGFVESGYTREETIRKHLDDWLGFYLDTQLLTIDAQTYNDFSSVGTPEPFIDANHNGTRDSGENYTDVNGNGQYDMDQGVASNGNAGDVVVYTISYPWSLLTPFLADSLGENGVVEVQSRFVVKNEPFNDD